MRRTITLGMMLVIALTASTELIAQHSRGARRTPIATNPTSTNHAGKGSLRVTKALHPSSTHDGTKPADGVRHTPNAATTKPTRSRPESSYRGGPPLNNDCAGATVLTPGVLCTPTLATTQGATQSIAAISCNTFTGTADDDVWFRFVATATSHTVLVQGDVEFDAVVDVRSGTCNGMNIGCADATVEGEVEQVDLTGLTIGNTYHIRVYDYYLGLSPTPDFAICVIEPSDPPANDDCANATQLTVGSSCVPLASTTLGATESLAALACNGFTGSADDDVWFRFVATASAITVLVSGDPEFDAVVDVRSGACNGANIGCADATLEGGLEQVQLNGLTVGNLYYVRVYDYYQGTAPTPDFTICVFTSAAAPPNDVCGDITSQALAVGGSLDFNGTTAGATTTGDAVPGSDMDDGIAKVWHAFTLNTCANVTVTYCGTTPVFDQIYIVVTDCPGSTFTAGSFEFTSCVDENGTVFFGQLAAGTYYLPVGQFDAGSTGPYTIEVSAEACAPAPANDDCAGAVPLSVGTSCAPVAGDVAGATESLPALLCNGFTGVANDDVWYSFVATGTTATIEVAGSTDFDAVVELRSAPCVGGSSLACADATLDGETEMILANGLTAGLTYYVRVYHYFETIPATTTFTICVYTSSGGEGNDDCTSVEPSPLTVGGNLTFNGTTVGATAAGDAVPGSDLEGFPIVWHAFTLGTCATVVVDYCGTTPAFEEILIVLTDCPADDYIIGITDFETCVDLNGTIVYPNLDPGTYYIPVAQIDGTATGPYTINVTALACAEPPANDACAEAIVLPVNLTGECPANATTGDNTAAAVTTDEPACDAGATAGYQDVWYSFNSLGNTNVTIDLDWGTATDLFIEVLDACNGTSVFCDIDNPAPYTVPVEPNTDYVVRAYSNNDFGVGGVFTICISAAISTGTDQRVDAGELNIYPNPAANVVNVVMPFDAVDVLVELIDVTGRQLMARRANFSAGVAATIDLPTTLASGSYVLRATHTGGSLEQRLMVE